MPNGWRRRLVRKIGEYMSKKPWVLGKKVPKLTFYMRITRAAKGSTCSFCHKAITQGEFYIRLSSAFGKSRYWTFHLFGWDCFTSWCEKKLWEQIEEIKEKRGTDPMSTEPYAPNQSPKLEDTGTDIEYSD